MVLNHTYCWVISLVSLINFYQERVLRVGVNPTRAVDHRMRSAVTSIPSVHCTEDVGESSWEGKKLGDFYFGESYPDVIEGGLLIFHKKSTKITKMFLEIGPPALSESFGGS